MASRKFNIIERTVGTYDYAEKVLSKTKKYIMKRDGTIVEYDDVALAAQKAAALADLDSQLGAQTITQGEYDTEVAQLEKTYNSLEQVITNVADDELIFSGSKSDIRKGEMSERNISILYNTKADVNALRYDIALFSPNEQPLAESIMAFAAPVPLHVGPNLSTAHGTVIKWEGLVSAQYRIAVKLNTNFLGYININPNGSWDTTVSAGFNIAPGDVLSYVTPDSFEADFKNLSITLAANQIIK